MTHPLSDRHDHAIYLHARLSSLLLSLQSLTQDHHQIRLWSDYAELSTF